MVNTQHLDDPLPDDSTVPEQGNRRTERTALSLIADAWSATWRPMILLLLGFGFWWLSAAREWVAPYLVPAPGDVWDMMLAERELLFERSLGTMYATVVGFAAAAAVGLLTAVLIVYSHTMERALYPVILVAQVIPKIAIAPILVVWFGLGMTPNIILAVLIAFFPVVISGVAGLRSVDPEHLDLTATMGASRLKTFIKVRFPASLPHLLSGLKVAITLAVVGAIVGEFVGAGEGLGTLLQQASGSLNAPLLFASLFCMGAIGILLFALVEIADRVIMPWHASHRTDLVTY